MLLKKESDENEPMKGRAKDKCNLSSNFSGTKLVGQRENGYVLLFMFGHGGSDARWIVGVAARPYDDVGAVECR